MIEKLIPIKLPPGFMRNGTKYDAKGRWYTGNLVRWYQGELQAIRQPANATNGSGFVLATIGASDQARLMWWTSTNGDRIVVATEDGIFVNDSTGGGTGAWTNATPASGWTGGLYQPQLESFGGSLLASRGGKIFEWNGTMASDFTEITGDPAFVNNIVVTPERFLFALGADSNPRLVKWPDQETTSVWTPTSTNQAGELELATRGTIVCGRASKGQTLIFTSTDLWSATYIGGDFIYSFRQEGNNCGICAPGAAVVVDGRAFWMGRNGFFMYDGYVRPLPCEVYDKVFGELSASQRNTLAEYNTITAMSVSKFNEIWWFYSTTGATNNRQVVYNYAENHWSFHELDRIAGLDQGHNPLPLMIAATDGRVYQHDDLGADPASGAYAESGPFEIGEGDNVMRIQRIVPDGNALTGARLTLYTSMFPIESETVSGPHNLANPIDVRVTGRQARVMIDGNVGQWRAGTVRLGVIPLGRR